MSRQDADAAFARTAFLYGGNADYIENLYERYEADPAAVDAEWRAFFESLKDDRADRNDRLDSSAATVRTREAAIGNLIADAMRVGANRGGGD